MTMQLTLDDQYREILTRILTQYLGDLKMEIGDTTAARCAPRCTKMKTQSR